MAGTEGDDILYGTNGNDVLNGEGGNDILYGYGGNDYLVGGAGSDTLHGGAGDDTYFVDSSTDVVVEAAAEGTDRVATAASFALASGVEIELLEAISSGATDAMNLTGNAFAQTISGNAGANVLSGEDGNDVLHGHGGNDYLIGGAGSDTLHGGAGDDTYFVDSSTDIVVEAAGQGTDRVATSASLTLASGAEVELLEAISSGATDAMNLTGNAFAQTISGNAGANVLKGEEGNDVLHGHGGNDYLIGGAGADVLHGGAGDDTFFVDGTSDVVVEAAGQGFDRVATSASLALASGTEVELLEAISTGATDAMNLTGNDFAQTISGNAGANVLNGEGGNDVLHGHGGSDYLIGGAGADVLYGGTGDDTYFVDGADVVVEAWSEGSDRVATSASFTLASGSSIELLEAISAGATDAMNLTGNDYAQTIVGNAGVNVLSGEGGNDVLHGQGGNDYLLGGAGSDSLYGGAGDDTYYLDGSVDLVVEATGEGFDRVATSSSYTLAAGAEVELIEAISASATDAMRLTGNAYDQTIIGNAGTNVLSGDDGNDVLHGHAGSDYLDGGAGSDTLHGGTGDDTYYVDRSTDVVVETAGGGSDRIATSASYTLASGVEIELLEAISSSATDGMNLTGNDVAQTIIGNAGTNIINGGGGNDTLHGYGGSDVFAFTAPLGIGNIDTIADFSAGVDTIALGDVFSGLASGLLGAGAFNTGSQASDADDRIIYNSSTGALLFDADGTGNAVAIQFATVSPGLSLSASSFAVLGAANGLSSITSGSTASVTENSPVDTVIYTATAVDPDGDTLTFSLGGTHADRFTIDPVTGVVRLRSPADFETLSTYSITVNAIDSSGSGDSQDVTVSVTNVAEGNGPYAVAEQEPNDTLATPQSLDRDLFAVTSHPNLPNASLPSATITGSIGATTDQDFYTVYLEAGELLIVDVDGTTNALDALVRVYGPNGVEIAMNDDLGSLDPGSSNHPQYGHNTDSFVRVRVPTSGLYTVSIEAWEGSSSGSYTMHVSVGPQATPAEINEENIEALIGGSTWGGLSLTYGFTTSASQYPSGHEEAGNNFETLNSSQRTAARTTFGMVSALTNLTFTEATASPGSAQLRLAMSDDPETAHAYYPGEGDGGDSWYNNTGGRYDAPTVGNYAYLTFIHEIGHSLGLKHGHESPALSPDRDSMEFSVMTYRGYIGASGDGGYVNETFGYAQSFMMYDIAALQRMYGANFNTNSGDTIYSWSPTTGAFSVNGVAQNAPGANRVFMTLWDGGGNDTYNLANYSTSVTIDLRPGEWTITSTVQLANLGNGNMARGNVANALLYEGNPASLIENAVGGSAADTIIANQVANRLTGGSGADTFRFHSTSDSAPGSLADIITDFVADSDRIDLSGIDANVNLDGNQAFSFIHNQAFSGVAGQVRYQAVGNNLHIFADTNGDSVADMQIILNNVSEVRAIDFWL